jgi:hypothetical protein
MKSFDAGHTETQTDLPDPLDGIGLWGLGTLALPAPLLSFASAVAFAVVWAILQLEPAKRELFVLPFPWGFAVGAVAAGIAWGVVVRCRSRPGRPWPRIWALALAGANSGFALLAAVFHGEPWPLTLVFAGLAAALTLAPRLLKFRPHSAMLQRIAPLTLALVLVLILPSACEVRDAVAHQTEHRVDRHIRQFRLWTTEVQQITGFDWRRMEDSPEAAAKVADRLKALRFAGELADAELWRSAATLGKEEELAVAARGLMDAVVAGLAPERVPRVSFLREPALRWDHQEKRWEEYSAFPRLSEITGTYHQELGRLFAELALEDAAAAGPKQVDLRQHHAAQRSVLQSHLNVMAGTWANNWAVFKVPGHGELIGREEAPLDEVLKAPFANGSAGTFAAADLWRLTELPLYRVRTLGQDAPGCLPQEYEEGEFEYFRLDCFSYAPRKEGAAAELRIEMRIVYRSESLQSLQESSRPVEIYFHFLIPEGEGSDNFREKVMTDLARVARESSQGVVRSTDRGGSVAGGFRLQVGESYLRVPRPTVVSLEGPNPEPRALRVRVERSTAPAGQALGGR